MIAERVAEVVRREIESLRAELAALRAATPGGDNLTTEEAATLAGVKPETVRDWIARRGLPARRPPGARDYRIARSDLTAFLAAPTARRPPKDRRPVDLSAEAARILDRRRR